MSTLPAFSKDVPGQYFGGAFWDNDDYRVRIETLDATGEKFLLTVETSDGTVIGQSELSREEADGIQKMGTTMHDIDVYEDDWKFPKGMSRVLTWTLPTDSDHTVVLNEGDISEMAVWFDYAMTDKVWDGGEDWEY